MKRLDEIAARLADFHKADATLVEAGDNPFLALKAISARQAARAALADHAPADLALLLKVARMVVDQPCDRRFFVECPEADGPIEPIDRWCVSCRIRRELGEGR